MNKQPKNTPKTMTRTEAIEYLEAHGMIASTTTQAELVREQKKEEAQRVRLQERSRKTEEKAAREADEKHINLVLTKGRYLGEPKVAKKNIFGDPIADIDW